MHFINFFDKLQVKHQELGKEHVGYVSTEEKRKVFKWFSKTEKESADRVKFDNSACKFDELGQITDQWCILGSSGLLSLSTSANWAHGYPSFFLSVQSCERKASVVNHSANRSAYWFRSSTGLLSGPSITIWPPPKYGLCDCVWKFELSL